MSRSVVDVVDEVRAARGLPQINPFKIEDDFRPGPEPTPEQQAQARANLQKPPEIPAVPQEEMLERPEPERPKAHEFPFPDASAPKLMILDGHAAVEGRGVELSEADQARIVRIVKNALVSGLREEIRKLGPVRVRKVRKVKAKTVAVALPMGEVAQMPKKKGGRPKGSKNKPKKRVDGAAPTGG